MKELTVEVASVPDRDELVAELWFGSDQVAELSKDNGHLVLQIYAAPSGTWELDYAQFELAITEMRRRVAK